MRRRNYTDEQFIYAVKNSGSIRQVLQYLGVKEAGGNYATAKSLIKKLNLNTDHFVNMYNCNLGKKFGPKRPLEDYISNKYPIQSFKLKNRLLEEKVFEYRCYNCNLEEWLGEPIPLELDHIDGNSSDNRLSNLRLLCPNCHALTPTYRGKNIKVLAVGVEPTLQGV